MPLALDAIEAATDGCLPTAARAQPRQRRPAAGRPGRRGRVPPSCAGHRRLRGHRCGRFTPAVPFCKS